MKGAEGVVSCMMVSSSMGCAGVFNGAVKINGLVFVFSFLEFFSGEALRFLGVTGVPDRRGSGGSAHFGVFESLFSFLKLVIIFRRIFGRFYSFFI